MPWLRPTITALRAAALDDLQNAPGGDGMALFRRAVGQSLAWALANQTEDLHEHLDWIALQSTPFTATDEYLEAWGGLVGVYRKGAVAWSGTATFPAVAASGGAAAALLPSGSVLTAGGNSYFTQADASASADGTLTATLTATVAGTAQDLVLGEQVTLTQGVSGITGTGAIASIVQPGVDIETDEAFRTRVLQRWASAPQGGAAADYLLWVGTVPGVTRAWVSPRGFGAGTVVLYTMFDGAEAASNGFPQGTDGVAAAEFRGPAATGDQLLVANALYPLRPVTAVVWSVSPIPAPQAFTIHGATPVPAAIQPLVAQAIDATMVAYASPLGAELELSLFEAAIGAVPGMPAFTITAPGGPIVTTLGNLPVRGVISYV